jgi:hypothetical protein
MFSSILSSHVADVGDDARDTDRRKGPTMANGMANINTTDLRTYRRITASIIEAMEETARTPLPIQSAADVAGRLRARRDELAAIDAELACRGLKP